MPLIENKWLKYPVALIPLMLVIWKFGILAPFKWKIVFSVIAVFAVFIYIEEYVQLDAVRFRRR